MAEHEIRDATREDIVFVAENMRHEDDLECQRSVGRPGPACLVEALDLSEYSGVITLDGEPATIYGVRRVNEVGIPWSMSTYVVDKEPMEFYRASKLGIGLIKNRYDVLINYVDASYAKAIRWLRRLGFQIGDPEPFGVAGCPFRPFFWRRHV